MLKIARVDDTFLEVFYLQACPVEGQSLQQKEKKRRKMKDENKQFKNRKAKSLNFDFCPRQSLNFRKQVNKERRD